jgi:hypothetical protein
VTNKKGSIPMGIEPTFMRLYPDERQEISALAK